MKRCRNCHKAMYDWQKPCIETWCGCERVVVWLPSLDEKEEDGREKFTSNSEDLAEELAQEQFNDDPCNPSDFSLTVCIKDRTGSVQEFRVTAQAEVSFYVSEQYSAAR